MPIQRTLPERDPTSPEMVLARDALKTNDMARKSLELGNITNIIHIVSCLVAIIAIVIVAVAVCKWTAEHTVEYVKVYHYCPSEYGTVRMEKK